MNPADLTLSISPNLTSKPIPPALTITPKNGRIPVPRVELEPIYTQLKSALGDGWNEYKEVVGRFVCGTLNQAELSWVLQPLLSAAPSVITSANSAVSPVSTLHLHNTLLAAIYTNTLRDPPPSDVAPWVVATDKPSTSAKNAGASGANDKAEERLKKEVMAIHGRDRRRIKTLKDTGKSTNDGLGEMQDYKLELSVKPPDIPAQSAGGITRTNWDIEIRRRYQQQLAEENLEFPTTSDIQNRIEPICYEEGLVGGVAQGVLQGLAEIVEQATEVYLKEFVGALYSHSRTNGEGCISTSKYKKQLRKEEDDVDRGAIQRNAAGLLPVELEVQATRQSLTLEDLTLAMQLEDSFIRQDQFLGQKMALNRYPDLHVLTEEPMTNGVPKEDAMVVDDYADTNWRGASKGDAEDLRSVLDECLAFG